MNYETTTKMAALESFRTQYPSSNSADLQAFVLGYKAAMSKIAIGTITESCGNPTLVLEINGRKYGEYPLNLPNVESSFNSALADAKDYGFNGILLVHKDELK